MPHITFGAFRLDKGPEVCMMEGTMDQILKAIASPVTLALLGFLICTALVLIYQTLGTISWHLHELRKGNHFVPFRHERGSMDKVSPRNTNTNT